MAELASPFDGRTEATAASDDLIAGYSCSDTGECHATMWKPSRRSDR